MKYILFLLLLLFGYNGFSQCTGLEPPYSLGPDTTICSGTVLTLTGPAGYSNYSWSNGSQAQYISLLNPGTYTVSSTIASLVGPNLVLNGDFENGTTAAANNFTTAYVPGTGGTWGLLTNPGQYAISTSPSLVHNNFSVCGDHTSGSGNMLIANGASTSNTTVWTQTVPVIPGQGYLFSFWVANALNDPAVAQLQLYVNNVPISAIGSPLSTACTWVQYNGTWVAGNATTNAILKIVNQSTASSGNDFSVDDILFRQVCTKKDTIVVAVNNVQVNGGPDLSFCEGDTDTLVATTNNVNNVLTWTPGGTPGSSTFVPTTSGVYTVTAVSPFGCTKTDNVNVTVRGMNWSIDSLGSIPSDCGDSTGQAAALVLPISGTLPPPLPFSYAWSGPGVGNPILTNGPLISNLSAGMYFLTVTSDGCSRDTFVQVGVNSAPIASFTATPTGGTAPLDVLFQNTSQLATGYYWNFGNGDSLTTPNLDDQNQTYVDTGVYIVYLVAYSGACSDTMFDTIYVYPPNVPVPLPEFFPVVFETSNVFTPNGDASNNFFTFKMENIVSLEVTIFNRWGDLMYQCNNPATFFWDGRTPEGIEANDGVYFYVYKATGAQKEIFEGNGFLHLFR
ncbi:MAG: gliding motility-associated C-terminal domain-containing protein [Crocinitomicaceae bacterium]